MHPSNKRPTGRTLRPTTVLAAPACPEGYLLGGEVMHKEIWKPIFDGQYEISSHGRVKRAVAGPGTRIGRILAGWVTNSGYMSIRLWLYGKPIKYSVHVLVAWIFIGPRPLRKEINHKDGNKLNNAAINLEWVTHKENGQHASMLNLMMRGEKHPRAKLTGPEVISLRRKALAGATYIELARQYGIARQTVGYIVRGLAWKHLLPAPDKK